MSDEEDTEAVESAGDPVWERSTAPQSPYTSRQVLAGLVVLIAGAIVTFGLPLALI